MAEEIETEAAEVTEWDFPDAFSAAFMVAGEALNLRPTDWLPLGAKFGADYEGIANELCEWAFARRHDAGECHATVVKAIDHARVITRAKATLARPWQLTPAAALEKTAAVVLGEWA